MSLIALVLAAGLAAPPEADIRALVERQQRAWNTADLTGYFSVFTPDAVFVDQGRGSGKITPYGRATLKEAQRQTRRFLATSKSQEAGQVTAVQVSGQQARAFSRLTSKITSKGATRTTCVDREQVFRLDGGRWKISTQTDTISRCPR